MNYPGLKPGVSRINDPKCLRFAPDSNSSPSLKARGFLAGFIKLGKIAPTELLRQKKQLRNQPDEKLELA